MKEINKLTGNLLIATALSGALLTGTLASTNSSVKAEIVTSTENQNDKTQVEANEIESLNLSYTSQISENGVLPDAKSYFTNKNGGIIPDNVKFEYVEKPDGSAGGDFQPLIKVTYPDGRYDIVKADLHVMSSTTGNGGELGEDRKQSNLYNPKGRDMLVIENEKGFPDPEKAIKNIQDLPENAKISWESPSELKELGDYPAVLRVDYSDDSKDKLNVIIHVGQKKEVNWKAIKGQNITTNIRVPVDAEKGILNKEILSDGATYRWKEEPNWNKEGKQSATIVVTDKNNTEVEVNITIEVNIPLTELKPSTPVEKPTPPTVPDKPVDPEKPVEPNVPEEPVLPEIPENNQTETPAVTEKPESNKQELPKQTPLSSETLPQTNEKNTALLSILGIVLSVASLRFFIKLKREKNLLK